MATLKEGARVIDRLLDDLSHPDGLEHAYAEAMFREAANRAQSKPTPQSRMAADAMGVRGSTITVLTGGAPAEVSAGSEWGSNIYRQFGPRNERGWWLMPSAESQPALTAGDRYLEQMLQDAIRGFF